MSHKSILENTAFLLAWLGVVIHEVEGEEAASALEALKAVQVYEIAARIEADLETMESFLGTAMRRSVIAHIARYGTLISQYWSSLVKTPVLQDPPAACFACGHHTNTYIMQPNSNCGESRRLRFCSGCGLIEDAPVSSHLLINVSEDLSIKLMGPLPQSHWTCGVVAGSSLQEDFRYWDWPAAENCEPVKKFQLTGPFPPGPLRIVVAFMQNAKLVLLQQPGRATECLIEKK